MCDEKTETKEEKLKKMMAKFEEESLKIYRKRCTNYDMGYVDGLRQLKFAVNKVIEDKKESKESKKTYKNVIEGYVLYNDITATESNFLDIITNLNTTGFICEKWPVFRIGKYPYVKKFRFTCEEIE